jgi:GNAT superfamily N-acetyltransferase
MYPTITEATLHDVPALSQLLYQLFAQEEEFTPNGTHHAKALQTIIENREIGTIFVAKVDNKAVGMVSLLFTVSTALGGKVAWLEDMVISTKHQSQGIGKALLAHAIKYAKAKQIERITLLTDQSNHKAQKFYQSFGFEGSPMIPMRLMVES